MSMGEHLTQRAHTAHILPDQATVITLPTPPPFVWRPPHGFARQYLLQWFVFPQPGQA